MYLCPYSKELTKKIKGDAPAPPPGAVPRPALSAKDAAAVDAVVDGILDDMKRR